MIAKFYNFAPAGDPGRRQQIGPELRALAASEPRVIGGVEALGYACPSLDGYRMLRDVSRPGRANVVAYIPEGEDLTYVRWHDLDETWSRTEHPGTHPARSWLEFDLGGDQFLVGHQPPKFTDNTLAAQREGVELVIRRTSPWTRKGWDARTDESKQRARRRRRMVLADWNRRRYELGPGPATVASALRGGQVHGSGIDAAVTRNWDVREAVYIDHPQGVALHTDHPLGALVIRAAA